MAGVLLVRAGALGDILLLRRGVACLGRAGHTVDLLAPAAPGSALVGSGPADVARVIAWERADVARLLADRDRTDPAPPFAELERYDAAIAYTSNEALVQRLREIIPRVVAWDPRPPGPGHASVHFARPCSLVAGLADEEPRASTPSHEEVREADAWLALLPPGFLSVHPGSGAIRKNWPPERYAALLDALPAPRPWLLVQGPAEDPLPPALARIPDAVVARELHPRLLGAILSRAALHVGNDAGVSHLAAAWGAPTLALFGPTDPAVWAPVGPTVQALRAGESMESLPVETVVCAARQLLAAFAHGAKPASLIGPRPSGSDL